MAAGYRPFCLSCCMRSAEAMTGRGVVGEGTSEGVEGIRVTMAGKENARCCGIEIGHGDVGGLDMGDRSVGLGGFQRAVGEWLGRAGP
jgi:hypothetical protein